MKGDVQGTLKAYEGTDLISVTFFEDVIFRPRN